MRGLSRHGSIAQAWGCRQASSLQFQVSDGSADASTSGQEQPGLPEDERPRHKLFASSIRAGLAAEAAASQLYAGQRAAGSSQPDVRLFQEKGRDLLHKLQQVAPEYRTRPSLLAPASSAAAFGLGAVSAVLPTNLRRAVTGAMQEAISEQYNDQLRELREAGLADEAKELRHVLRDLRDEERAPEGGVKAPDLMRLQRPQDLSLEEGVAGVVKWGFRAAFAASAKV